MWATANICKADCSKNDSSVVYCSGIDMFLAGLGIRSLVFQANHSLVFWANRSFFVSIIAFRFFPNIESLFPSLLKSNGSKLFMVAIENKKRKSIEKLSKKTWWELQTVSWELLIFWEQKSISWTNHSWHSFLKSNKSNSLLSLFCTVWWERFAHSCSFVKSDESD